jgi:excisionase family DNA binding protein
MSSERPDRKPMQLSLFFRSTRNAVWVADYLNTSPQSVCRLIQSGHLDAYRLTDRGPWCIFLDSVEAYIRIRAQKYGQEHRLNSASENADPR